MMQRVLWKEWHERRLVYAALALAAIAPVILGSGLSFSGELGAFSPWVLLPIALAIRLGIGMYAKDGDQDSGDFLYSRPVDWKALLAAKLVPGIAAVLAACVLAALAYRLFARPQYQPFINEDHLVAGAAFLAMFAVLGFAAGYASSGLSPGKGGSGMVFAGLYALSVFYLFAHMTVHRQFGQSGPGYQGISVAAWYAGAFVAALFVTRFGLTAGFRYRLKVYALCIGAALAVLIPVETGYNAWLQSRPPAPPRLPGLDPDSALSEESFLSVSPDGKHGVTSVGPSLVRLEGRRVTPIRRLPYPMDVPTLRKGVRWTPSGRAYWTYQQSLMVAAPRAARVVEIRMPEAASLIMPSPDGRSLVYSACTRSDDQRLYFVDLEAARRLDGMVQSKSSAWWQTADTVGYTDASGKRAFVKVSAMRRLPPAAPARQFIPPARRNPTTAGAEAR